MLAHPHLELVGLYVHSRDKVGKDAGELIGTDAVGVVATNSIDDIVALRADFPVEPARNSQVTAGFTVHPAVNAVPAVCGAAPASAPPSTSRE